jgi:hypothetical protein
LCSYLLLTHTILIGFSWIQTCEGSALKALILSGTFVLFRNPISDYEDFGHGQTESIDSKVQIVIHGEI